MQMQPSSDVQIPDGLLAANALLAENSHQGFGTSTHTLHQGFGVAISSTALGIKESLYDGRIRSRYTAKERDTESGNDYFGARYYGSNAARFLTPDWSAKATPVPYAHIANPQSLNLYSFVYNNPLTNIDADGHSCGAVTQNSDGTYSMRCGNDPPPPPPPPLPFNPQTPPKPPTKPTVPNPTLPQVAQCAANGANQFSIAGVLGVDAKANPSLAALSNAFLGNTFSGITNAFTGGGSMADTALGGSALGLPIGSTNMGKGMAGVATDAAVNAISAPGSSLSGVTGAATALGEEGLAGPVGIAKTGIDLAAYLAAAAHCAN